MAALHSWHHDSDPATTERKTAIEVGAAATAASYAVFHDIRYRGLDRATGRGIIERAALTAAARLTLREDQMFFFPFPFESARSMRERGWPESQIRTWIRGRLHKPTDEDLRGWDAEDIAEYRAILNDKPYTPRRRPQGPRRLSFTTTITPPHPQRHLPPLRMTNSTR